MLNDVEWEMKIITNDNFERMETVAVACLRVSYRHLPEINEENYEQRRYA
jgi:hypothetical protein